MTQAGRRTKEAFKSIPETVPLVKALLSDWSGVEPWQRDNEYLLGRYRTISNSYTDSLRSLFYLHNQTGNIYSHLVPAVIFTAYGLKICPELSLRYPTADAWDLLAFGVYIACATMCFGFSATFHIFGNHSNKVYKTWLMMDLYGIFVIIVGTVFSGTYYGFYCEPIWWISYSAGITIVVSIGAVLIAAPQFQTPGWRKARAVLFVAIGWYGAFPMTHAAQVFSIKQAHKQMGWWYFIAEGLSYISGALIYAVRIPERFRPGLFDIWGSSHQIFHFAAVAGATWHLAGLMAAFDYNHNPTTRRC